MAALLVFTGLNAALVSTIGPVYDFVCFLPFWERRRERRREEREAAATKVSGPANEETNHHDTRSYRFEAD